MARFHFYIIDSGWKSVAARVIRDNFKMIREFQNHDPLYVLTQQQSIALIRANPDWIGKDPIILVYDVLTKTRPSPTGYRGFRLCLGLIKNSEQAVTVMQDFLRFVHSHRRCQDIEQQIEDKLHREGWKNTLEVLRHSASELAG
ncbi:MAG: hypothetical protein ACR2HF_02430 [Methylococcaceae bacterium]